MKRHLLALLALALTTPCVAQPRCTPAPAGLAAWWTFDEVASNTVADRLGGRPGTLRNRPVARAGRVAGALVFEGADWVDVPGARLNAGREDFSLALWIRITQSTGGVITIIDKREISGNAVRGFSLWANNGRPGFQLADNGGPSAMCSNDPKGSACTNYGFTPSIADGAWHSLIVSVNRGANDGGALYVDGRLAGTFDPTIRRGSLDNDAPFRIGAHAGTPARGFVQGLLDEVQFYRRALDADEAARIASAGDLGLCKDIPPTRVVSLEESRPRFVPGIVVIKLGASDALALRNALARNTAFASLPFPPDVRALNVQFGAVAVRPLFPSATAGAPGGIDRVFVLTIDKTRDTRAAAYTYARANGVEYAEPDRIGRIQGFEEVQDTAALQQWNRAKIGLSTAQKITGKDVVVAVLDSGIDRSHPDLAKNIWVNQKQRKKTPADPIDSDINGWDFVDVDNAPDDPDGHGTHVAGIIAAADNSIGITGVAPGAKLMAVRCVDENGEAASTGFAACVEYAATSGAKIINSSWVVEATPDFLEDTVFYARSRDVIFVAAGGNDNLSITKFAPANAESAITVASTTSTDDSSGWNYGTKLDVAAPGDAIVSTYPGNKYAIESGTSMATPHVAGLAALLVEAHSDWTPEQIRQAIRRSSFDIGPRGYDDRSGFGRIDAAAALAAPKPPVATIERPYNGQRISGMVKILGAAGPQWKLSIISPNGTPLPPLNDNPNAQAHGVLHELDTTRYPDGVYTLFLTAKEGSAVGEDRNVVLIDNATRCPTVKGRKRCWPIEVGESALKSPRVADLDRNGTKEIILGTAVFDADGEPRPGWVGATAGYGRTNPAIADIDSDGDLEIVAAVWHGLTYDDDLPHGGAPIVRAFDHAGKTLWSHKVKNPNDPDEHNGTPSSISIADVDGIAGPEIVFTVFFRTNNNARRTHVFILDAKGKLQKQFAVAGRSVSSVALVPSGNGRLLVIPTDRKLHVVRHDGVAAPGWPQHNTSGEIDPVVADFDLDDQPEILAGPNLWNLDGTPENNYPATGLVQSTGSAGQLVKSDCQLEVVLGGGGDVLYSVSRHHDATRKFSARSGGESIAWTISDDNGSSGVPIVADLNGDGEPDIVRPSERAFDDDRSARLYATKGSSATVVAGFPRYIDTERGIVHSSAVVDDIDNDGKTDLLIAGFEKLYAWNLGTTFDPANNPWPMFQHDLAHTGYLPPSPKGSDLWIEDTPVYPLAGGRDTGSEPSSEMTLEPTWTSRAIRVRNRPNDPGPHQNPVAGQTNVVMVTVNNRGCKSSAQTNVEVLSADASKGLAWPISWTVVGAAPLPPIKPGESKIVEVKWTPQISGHFSLVARVAGEAMTFAEGGNIETNTRKNNNVAWRRVTAVDLLTRVQQPVTVNLANMFDHAANVDVKFLVRDKFVADGGRILLKHADGQFRPIGTGLTGIALQPKSTKPVELIIAAPNPLGFPGTSKVYTFDVIETIAGVPVGGVSYSVTARGTKMDTDGDGTPDVTDLDDDNDKIPDRNDPNPLAPVKK